VDVKVARVNSDQQLARNSPAMSGFLTQGLFMDYLILAGLVILATVVAFGKSEECYFCGSRNLIKRSRFKTRGACSECDSEGGKL
jgi:hypothetical protein